MPSPVKTTPALLLRWMLPLAMWLLVSMSLQLLLLSRQAGDAWQNAFVILLSRMIGPAMDAYLGGVVVAAWFPAANHGAVYQWILVVPVALVFVLFVAVNARQWRQPSAGSPTAHLQTRPREMELEPTE